jgi:hypothetical protein
MLEEVNSDYAIKTAKGTAPVINGFTIENFIGVTYYPNPLYFTFLGFDKDEFNNAMLSSVEQKIPLYLVAKIGKTLKQVDVSKLDSGVEKAITFRDLDGEYKILVLTKKGALYKDTMKIADDIKDIGVYWTHIKSLQGGCVNNTVTRAQLEYLQKGCGHSNPSKRANACRSGWGGVGAKEYKEFDENNRAITMSTCKCSFYQEFSNEFSYSTNKGFLIYLDNNGKWHSLIPYYNCHLCDGSNVSSRCYSSDNQEKKEIVESLEFFMDNKQIGTMLISKSISGEFYEVPIFPFVPARVSYATKGELNLTF